VKFIQTISLKEFREADRIVMRKNSFAFYFILYFGWAMGLLLMALGWWFRDALATGRYRSHRTSDHLFIIGIGLVIIPFYYRTFSKILYEKARRIRQQTELEITDRGLKICPLHDDASSLSWDNFRLSVEGPNVFALAQGRKPSRVISKRALTPDQQSELRTLLATHIPRK